MKDWRATGPASRFAPVAIPLMLIMASHVRAQSDDGTTSASSPQVATINQQVADVWGQFEIRPSPPATNGEWCRRVFLDVLGRIPSLEELESFSSDRSSAKRERLVARLLDSEVYVSDYARNWTTIWTNILIGRTGGTNRRDLCNRAGMQKFLRDSFANNVAYDQFVRELLTARGTTAPGTDDFNGATNFLVDKLSEKATLATTKTSQVFLGIQVQCTQCHDHPFNEWKQNQFWELNAFFRQTRALRRFKEGTRDIAYVELTDQDFAGEGETPTAAETYYEQRNGILKAAYPVFVDGTPLENRSGFLSDVNRREELARRVLDSSDLALALVNRMWAHFLGYGFTKPYDDFGPHNSASHPELLDYLAQQFRDSGYDLKPLIKWIVLSRPYALSSRTHAGNQTDDPQLGETPKFSRFYLRQMRAEELYESLLVATAAHKSRSSYAEQEQAKSRWLRQFSRAFGTDEGDETTTFNGSIPQALMMFNGELVKQATSLERDNFLAQVAKSEQRPQVKIRRLYLAALARKPTAAELRVVNELVKARQQDWADKSSGEWKKMDPVAAALQDIWWAVLNSNEFIMNH